MNDRRLGANFCQVLYRRARWLPFRQKVSVKCSRHLTHAPCQTCFALVRPHVVFPRYQIFDFACTARYKIDSGCNVPHNRSKLFCRRFCTAGCRRSRAYMAFWVSVGRLRIACRRHLLVGVAARVEMVRLTPMQNCICQSHLSPRGRLPSSGSRNVQSAAYACCCRTWSF